MACTHAKTTETACCIAYFSMFHGSASLTSTKRRNARRAQCRSWDTESAKFDCMLLPWRTKRQASCDRLCRVHRRPPSPQSPPSDPETVPTLPRAGLGATAAPIASIPAPVGHRHRFDGILCRDLCVGSITPTPHPPPAISSNPPRPQSIPLRGQVSRVCPPRCALASDPQPRTRQELGIHRRSLPVQPVGSTWVMGQLHAQPHALGRSDP